MSELRTGFILSPERIGGSRERFWLDSLNHNMNNFASIIQGIIGPTAWKLGKNQSILTLPISLTSAFNFTSVAASLFFLIESSVFIPIFLVSWGLRGGRPQGCSSWNTHTHTPEWESSGFSLLTTRQAREGAAEWDKVQSRSSERKRYGSSASTLHSVFAWSEDLWYAAWLSLS